MKLNKENIIEELKNGICELTIVSEHCSVSETVSATLSPNHLPDSQATVSDKPNIVVYWDMVDEKWCSMHSKNIGDIERLTGLGVKDKEDAVEGVEVLSLLSADI